MVKRSRTPRNRPRRPRAKTTYETGLLGAFERDYPPRPERARLIEAIRKKPEADRSADEWWRVGSLQVFEGLLDEDDRMVNEGIEALTTGAEHERPSPACLMDLATLLLLRKLDALALRYCKKATELVPHSRDAWSLRGWAHVRLRQLDDAVRAFEVVVGLPRATAADRGMLQKLRKSDVDLERLGRDLVLMSIDFEEIASGQYGPEDSRKAGAQLLEQVVNSHDPDDPQPELLNALAGLRYSLGQYPRAEKLLKRYLEVKPDDAEGLTMLALIAEKTERVELALQYYRRALVVDPAHLLALVNLAAVLQEAGDYHQVSAAV